MERENNPIIASSCVLYCFPSQQCNKMLKKVPERSTAISRSDQLLQAYLLSFASLKGCSVFPFFLFLCLPFLFHCCKEQPAIHLSLHARHYKVLVFARGRLCIPHVTGVLCLPNAHQIFCVDEHNMQGQVAVASHVTPL